MSAQYTAFLDANVLYSAPLRDLLMELSVCDVFQARWSNLVLDEMKRNLLKNRPDILSSTIDITIQLMNESVRDSCVEEIPEELIEMLKIDMRDKDDAHVIAGAIISRAHSIVTWNIKDFPKMILDRYRLEVIEPDKFLVAQFDLNNALFMESVIRIRERLLKNPKNPKSIDEYLKKLIKNNLVETAAKLREFKSFL